jgi:hypothetical protein
MTLRKTIWKIILGLLVFCMVAVTIEVGTSLIRGYGFVGTIGRMSQPYNEPADDLRAVIKYCDDYYAEKIKHVSSSDEIRWPEPNEIAAHVTTLRLAMEQPYKKFGISLFQCTSHNCQYLYAPRSTKEHDVYWDDPNYYGVVIMCTLSKWEAPPGVYHPYKKYPKFVRDYIEDEMGGERWNCWISTIGFTAVGTDLPPVPGAILFDAGRYSPRKSRYDKKMIPAIKAIYPNLKVPDGAIIE